MLREMYHTQESREQKLKQPIICKRDDAWLGEGYYFWYYIEDAEMWGTTSKKNTGYYEIYKSKIDCTDFLDTVFNETHYTFWVKSLEKVAKKIIRLTGCKPTLKELNDYFKEKAIWKEVTGILFQDNPINKETNLVEPIKYNKKFVHFVYRKRIQAVVYYKEYICTFALLKKGNCND